MDGTLSLYHSNINTKLLYINELITILFEEYDMATYDNRLTEIDNDYKSNCIFIFTKKFLNNNDLSNEYIKMLESINTINNIDNLVNDIKYILNTNPFKKLTINNIYRNIENIKIKINNTKIIIDICDDCGADTQILHDQSILQCTNDMCSKITNIITSNFDATSNAIKPSRNKTKRHKSDEHCELWLKRIQAKENKKIPIELINKLVELTRYEYTVNGVLKKMDNMQCSLIRRWLHDLNETKYYNNSPLIRKLVTGYFGKSIIPPQLTEIEEYEIIDEFNICIEYFDEIITNKELLETIGKEEIKYKSYYPDILYRLLNEKLKYDQRKKRILECIRLQNEKTLIKNDKIWQMICKLSDRYTYRPIII